MHTPDSENQQKHEKSARSEDKPKNPFGPISKLSENARLIWLATIFGATFGPVLFVWASYPRYLYLPAVILCLIILYGVHVYVVHTENDQSPATQPTAMPESLRSTFKQLRDSFDQLAMQSKGLHHVMVERQLIQSPLDGELPPVVVGHPAHPDDPRRYWSVDSLPGEPARPVALTEEERKAIPVTSERDEYIRDGSGRPLAKWEPSLIRMGHLYGDNAPIHRFNNLSQAIGQAMLGIPNEMVARLPESIRPLFRVTPTVGRRYTFGEVPSDVDMPWMGRGFLPGGMGFENGVIVHNIEPGTGDHRDSAWLLLLHRMGWEAKPGDLLLATRWYWRGAISVPYGRPIPNHPGINLPEIPLHRFYSVLSPQSGGQTIDICAGSAWAIDRLLELLS